MMTDRASTWTASAIGLALLALLSWWAIGCAGAPTFDQQFHLASRAYLAAKKGYLAALSADNNAVRACYQAHPDLHGADAKLACPPMISVDVRATAMTLVEQADLGMYTLNAAITIGAAPNPRDVEALMDVQAAALQIPLLISGEVR